MKLKKIFLGLLLFLCNVVHPDVFYSPEIITQSTFVVNQPGPLSFTNDVMYKYDPIDIATGLPMMKIIASDVDIDFNNIGIYNMNQTNNCWIAVEIGWTPAELAADTTREQPKNIRIKNLKSYGFCAGLLIHAGVQDVQIINCSFYDMELGVAMLGKSGQECRNIALIKVNIVGLEDEPDQNLTLLKNMIETDYGYGADYFMPLQPDTLNGNTLDVTTYYGLYAQSVIKGTFKKVDIHNVGYKNYNQLSEGNGARTHTYGIFLKNSRRIEMESVASQEIDSELYAVGMRLDNINEITLNDCNFSYCTSGTKAVGIEVTNVLNKDYSVNALKMNNVVTKTHVGGTSAMGMDLSYVRGLIMDNVISKYNTGGMQGYGLYANSLYTATIENTTLSENSATRVTNDVATTQGIHAAGFYGINVNSVQCTSVDFNSIQALNGAYGLYLSNSSSCQFFDSNFVGNIATMMRSGEAAAIRAAQDTQEISKNAPVVTAAGTGAYGVYVQNSKYLRFERCVSNSNIGHRAMGFNFQNCRAVAMYSTFASTQTATGQMFDSSWVTDNVQNPQQIPIIDKHQPLLFGDSTKTHVDLVSTTDLFLQKIGSIRSSYISGGTPSYSDVTGMIATSSLIQAAIARYRLWSVAIGILVQNVAGFLLQDCLCVGQLSMYDNGVGICFAGRNNGHTLKNCNLSFNVGGYASAQTANTNASPQYGSSYNLIGLKPFWDVVLQQQAPWTQFQNGTLASAITAIAYSPDETKLAIGLSNNTILIYDTVTWSVAQTLTDHTSAITALAWNSDGTMLASSDSGILNNIKIWNTSSWAVVQNLSTAVGVVSSLAWNPNGNGLISAGAGILNNIIHWDTSLWSVLHSLTHGLLGVGCVAWSADGTKVATSSNDLTNNIKIWDTSSWTAIQTFTGSSSAIKSLSWRKDGSQLASGSSDGLVKIWETTGWTLVQTLNGAAGAVTNVKFKPDGQWIAAGYANNVLKIFKTSTWALGQTLSISSGAVQAFDWSFTGRRIAYGGGDSTYHVYATDIFNKAASTLVSGLYTPNALTYTLQDSLVYGAAVSDSTAFVDVNGTKRNMVSPVGPMGAGLVMGDMMLEGLVENCQIYSNIGHAGNSYGVLLDKGYSITLQNNTIAGNAANVHGIAAGILDVTAHTPNLYIRNTLEGNKCSIFNNSNYFIPFNSADANNLAFPVNKIKNGSFTNPTTDYDNTVIEYSLNSQFYQYDFVTTIPLHPDLRSYLSSTNCWN